MLYISYYISIISTFRPPFCSVYFTNPAFGSRCTCGCLYIGYTILTQNKNQISYDMIHLLAQNETFFLLYRSINYTRKIHTICILHIIYHSSSLILRPHIRYVECLGRCARARSDVLMCKLFYLCVI